MYYAIARFKSVFRWLVFQTGTEYHPYSDASEVPGYKGSYTWRGHCVAFRCDDNSVQFCW